MVIVLIKKKSLCGKISSGILNAKSDKQSEITEIIIGEVLETQLHGDCIF